MKMSEKILDGNELIKRCMKEGITKKDARKMFDIETEYMEELGIIGKDHKRKI
jgi:hypothetical protein